MSPNKSLFGRKKNVKNVTDYPLPPSCSVSNLTEFLADGNASFLRAARSGNLEKVIEFLKGTIDINTSNANGLNALHLAAKEGHVNVVTELIKRGANVNAATKKGNTALHIASLAGQEEVVKVLVQLGANVNVQSQNGFTPLYMAAQENHDAVVSFLLANGANQSLATEDGFTPLAVALQQGHDKVVAVLLENDTKGKVRLPALHIAAKKDDCKAATLLLQSDHNPDVTSKSGFTPLHIAAHYGNENIAKILLSKGADVNYAAKHQITPLHVASKWGKINMVTLLLEKGANIDAATRDGLTPLHCAARSGHDQVVDLLLEKGAPFLAKTKNGLAPLHMASQGDHVDSARILLYHKAPVDDVTVDYLTALHVAAHCGHVKVAKLLLDRKADPNARALNGFTPLHIACKKNRIKVVELLLKHGASIEATTESGLTPLHVASFMGCMNIVIYLIQNGSNPDVPTVRGETPLHLAARANQTDIIRILLRNGASVDARAREEQTPLHIAARLGNVDIVSLLLQHGAAVDAMTKDMYTPLHITAKEDQEEVAAALLDHGASLTATTKKGFTPLHLAAKYGNIKVARLLLQKGAPVDAQGKNGVTPLHVAAHYDHVNVALLLLDKGASPHAMAKNGYTPLHIAAKKNQMDIASTLLEYGANTNSESKAGFTPLHLSAQEGHADMSSLLIENKADVNHKANNGLTPLHLCAQDDRVNVAQVLVKNGAEICPQTKAGYTPLHVASHFGQINMVRFLLQNNANVHTVTSHGYTPLHQAAQQGHTLVVNLLLENQASPNVTTVQGQTPLSIAQRLGYISVVETLKVVTETTVTTTTTTVTEEKYKVVAPETMQETFMTDSEDEGGEEAMLGDQSYRYLTADEMKSLGDDSLPIDVTKDEKQQDAVQAVKQFGAPMVEEDNISPQHGTPVESGFSEKFSPDNIDLVKAPVHAGMDDAYYYLPPKGMLRSSFLVSFMVDARGGAMRGCRHSGVRVIIPPRKASMPMRITCRYLRKEKLIHPPPLMEGEACASRILEMGPVGARFLGPVIIEVPHFASTRGKEREITILRSDTGESWREHTLEASEEAVQEVLNESFEGEELSALEDLNTNRITRILTTDFPQYFAIVTRIRQEVHGVGPEGGMVSSTVVPQVQAIFPEGALTKKIRVGLQAQPIAPELVTKLLGNRVAVSPIVTVEPRRRKFHKPITLTIPVPQAATKGMINQYSGDAPTLRLLCSITGSTKSGGSSKAQWEDVTGSTPLTFVNDCVSFTTTVSARFWLMDCRQVNEVTRFATELYQEAVYVPFMSKFVIFAKRHDPFEAQLRVFCMTDDKEDKTLESQEHFTEVAKSRDVEVLEGKLQYLEFAGNLIPVTKSGEQLKFTFQAFHENRLPFIIRVKDPHAEPMGRIAFMKEPKAGRGEPPQTPICNLNVALPEITMADSADVLELVTLEKRYDFIQEAGLSKPELIHRADLRLSDIARELDKDWVLLAQQLDVPEQDVEQIKAQTVCDQSEQARMMLRVWLQKSGPKATGNELEKGLRKINREDIIKNCMFNVELVTDDVEKAVAKVHLDQSGFDVFKEELGSSREASMRRGTSLDDEQDIMKEAESAAETSSETGSLFERDQLSQALTDDRDAKIRRASKTPPPSPIDETIDKGGIEMEKLREISSLLPELREYEVQKPEESDFRKVEIVVKENVILSTAQQEIPNKLTESETWQSGDLDTSQVSVSSLPEDDKSEQTTTTVSSTAIQEVTKNIVPDTEIMDIDKSGTTTHIIQKTTHMTLISHTKPDSEYVEGDLQGDIPVDSKMDEETSPHSPELSFAEKRDFFQKLSLSSSSPSVTPTHTSKTNIETEIKLLPVTDNIANLEVSPEEQLSFVERVKFFESSAEKRTVQTVQTIMPEVKEIKKEVWTVSENELNEPKSSVYSDETFEKEREIETIEVLEETSHISTIDIEGVSPPLYANKEVLETTFDTNKDAKVEVMVKKFSPGSEMFEICSVENISKPEGEHLTEVTNAISKVTSKYSEENLIEKKETGKSITEITEIKYEMPEKIVTEIRSEIDVPTPEMLSDIDKPETDEEYISKTFKAVTESSYEASRSTVGAFKKGINEKLENKWQRESPDNISIVKETMEPSLGKSEIFICTEETLDNVKKILSVADAESNIVVPENESTSIETSQEGITSETLDRSTFATEKSEKVDRETAPVEKSDADSIEVIQEKIKSREDDAKVIDEPCVKIAQNVEVSCEIEISKELIKDIEIKELDKETEIRIEPEMDKETSKKISEEIKISTELIKNSEIKELCKETEVKIEPEDLKTSKKVIDDIEISKEVVKDTEIKELVKEVIKDTEIKELVKEMKIRIEPKKDDEISKKISDDINIRKELVKDNEIKGLIKESKIESKKDDEVSKKIVDEFKVSKEKVEEDEIDKKISDKIETNKEICAESEKDSEIIQYIGVTEDLIVADQSNARPDSIIKKSSVSHTTTIIQESNIISKGFKDKSSESDVKGMSKESIDSKAVPSEKVESIDTKDKVQQGKISPSSIGDKSDASSKEKSIEIEFVPVLEVSNDVKVAVDKTGHEALGTPCSFHKEMSIESQHTELEQSFEKRQLDTEKKIPLTAFAAVEKAEYEEVEKSKKENIESTIYRESVRHKTTGKETVQSVEVTQFNKHSTEVYNVPSEKLKEKFSSKKIHIGTSSEDKDSKSFIPQKLNQFLDSVTQAHDISLPSDVTPVHKRTEEWLDQSGDLMLKEGAIIDNVDNGLFEDRPPTLEDEHQRRSSPTAESFDDKARVEQCDTDVMMQLLDFVSRNDIELAEVRTEDEAPDIEEDVSPSGEEEICSRVTYEESKVDDKIPENFDEKSDEHLKVSKSDNLQLSPLRSSFDSVTSPSKRDFSSDNIETVIETKHSIEELKYEQIHPQSSLEVEVGSHGSDEMGHLDIDREIVPLSFVEEEESAKIESKHSSSEEKFSKFEDIKQCTKETATASIVIDSVGKSSIDLNENQDKIECQEEIKGALSELKTAECVSDAPVDSAQAVSKSDKDFGEHVEPLHPETDTVDSEELCKITKDLYISEKDSDLVVETQYVEKTNSSFTSCAFINTAFAGADAIDEVEQVIPVRARSPYEVIRGEDDQVHDIPVEESKTNLSATDRVTYITRHVEIKRRPLLQHIPSEISEEDLVEREIMSPIPRDELESSDQSVDSESKMPKTDISDIINIKTMPLEDQDREISTVTIVKTVSASAETEDKVDKDNSSDLTIIKSVTVTKTEDSVCVDQSLDYQENVSIKDELSEMEVKSDISEVAAKVKDIVSPETDTGIPTSPFELISESELSDGEHKASTSAISHSSIKSEKDDKSKDSVITATHSQSVTEKTISVSAVSSDEQKDSCTLNGNVDTSETLDVCNVADHSSINIISDTKPLTNGPGEVEYHPEYDDDDEDISKKFEHVYAVRSAYEAQETDEEPKCHYSSVSDDVIDSEIREILSSDQQLEDIIERPVTPEPPRDDITNVGFISHLKRPSDVAIEGLMREEGFAYSDDAPLSSPTSPDSKSGFAYGMHFEKYAIDEGEEAMDIDSDQFSEEKDPPYSYNMRFERDPDLEEDVPCYGDLYTHEEEDEDALENGEKSKAMQKPGKDSEFDILAGRKYFTKNVEIDELSMSSLQEFERLEAEIVSGRKSSVGSLDSLNGKQIVSKSGDHDDVSMSSLTEFERIEKECTEGDKIDPSMQESITQLSEIEEGHESQASEASQENKSDVGREDDISIADDYNNQLENIDEIILEVESKKIDELPFQIMMKQKQKPEQTGYDTEIISKEKQIINKISDTGKEKITKASVVTEVTKITSWATSKSLESSSLGDARDDLDQDSLRDELSLKPDSLIDDTKLDFQDSLHEERFDDADSLQENLDEMRDSLFEERHIEDDSLHEMDIMPDESSLSLEGSLPAIASLDSSKADEPIKSKITNILDSKDIHPEVILGSATETFQVRQTQINISDLPRGADIMQSSTDSLEQSSSALAAFQIESESLMSSSLNSAITSEDNTMVSSSDTIEPEGRITYRYEDIPVDDIEMLVRSGHRVIVDSEGNIQAHYEGKQCIETEEIRNTALGFHKNVTEIKLPPTTTVQVHSALTTVEYVNGRREQDKHFHHTSGKEDYESFESSHFDPDVEVEEVQTTDEFGNTKIIRKIKKVSHTKTQFSSSSSPKDVEEKLKEFLRDHTAGDKAGTAEEEVEEQKTTDEKGNVVVIRTVKRQIHTEPEIHSKTFTGPTADQQSQKFVETFQTLDPTEDVSEYEKVDEQGNVVRVTEKFVVTPKVHTVSFSGPDAHKQMEDYMKQWTLQSQNVGEFEGDQQRAVLPSLQTGRTFELSETSAPSDSSQHLVQTVIGDTIVTKTLSSTFPSDSTEKTEIPESSTSTISLETVRSKSDSSEDKKSMPK